MVDSSLRGDIGNILAMNLLLSATSRHEVGSGHQKDGVRALDGFGERGFGGHVGLQNIRRWIEKFLWTEATYCNYLNTLGSQSLGGGLGRVASDAPDRELLGENGIREDSIDDRAALVSGGPKDGDKLRHD